MDKIYIATLTQTGTNAPVATELENSLGSPVWSRSGSSVYVGTLAGAFSPLASTTIAIPVMTDIVSAVVTDINSVTITTNGDGKLTNREVQILVSTHYCNQFDLERRISREILSQYTKDTTNPTIPDPTVIESTLANVDAIIDAKAGQVYTIPLTMPEPKVKQIAIDLACFAIMQRRPAGVAMPKEWDDANKQALKDLEDISNELLRLSTSQTVASTESNIVTPTASPVVDFYDVNNGMSIY
jgi:phage gp36-like protein